MGQLIPKGAATAAPFCFRLHLKKKLVFQILNKNQMGTDQLFLKNQNFNLKFYKIINTLCLRESQGVEMGENSERSSHSLA